MVAEENSEKFRKGAFAIEEIFEKIKYFLWVSNVFIIFTYN